MTLRRILFTAAAVMALGGCTGADGHIPQMADAAPSAAPYQLGPGDQVRINVYELEGMNETYLVSDTGVISLPIIGAVPVSGKSIDGVESAIADVLRAKQLLINPKVSAQIITYRPFFITGEVQKPGQYSYVPGMSVMTAISVAGGYTFRANTKEVTITRGRAKARAIPDSDVQPGDLIQVRESWF